MISYIANLEKLTIEASGQMLALNDPSIISNFTINLGHEASAQVAPSPTITQAPLNPRGLGDAVKGLGNGITSLGGDVNTAAHSAASHVDSAVTNAVSTAAAEASTVKSDVTSAATHAVSTAAAKASSVATDVKTFATDIVSKAISGFDEGGTSTLSLSVGPQPTSISSSPFGQADKIGTIDGLTIWCVDCGASGNIGIGGDVAAGLDGITGGSLRFEALEFKIPLTFGFEASKTGISQSLKSQLFEIPLTPLLVEPFFSIGPKFTFAVDFNVWVGTTGNLKAGADMQWGNASAAIQFFGKDKNEPGMVKNIAGWDPEVEKVFDFSGGELNLNVTLGIPMAFNVGLTLLQHQVSKSLSITDIPSIELDSTFNLPSNARRGHPRDLAVRDDSCKRGIAELVSFKNAVDFNVFNFWHPRVASFSTSLYSTCFTTATPLSSASLTRSSSPSGPLSSGSSCPGSSCPGSSCPGSSCPGSSCPGSSSPGSSSSSPSAQPSVQLTSSSLSPTRSAIIDHATALGGSRNTNSSAYLSNPTGAGWYPSGVSVDTAYHITAQGASGTDVAVSRQGATVSPTATGGFLSNASEAMSSGVKSLKSLDISLGTSSVPTDSLYISGVASRKPIVTGAVTSDGLSAGPIGVSGISSGFYPTTTGGTISKALEASSAGVAISIGLADSSFGLSSAPPDTQHSSGVYSSTPTATDAVTPAESFASRRIPSPSTGLSGVSAVVLSTPTTASVTSISASAATKGTSTVSGGITGPITVVTDANELPTVIP